MRFFKGKIKKRTHNTINEFHVNTKNEKTVAISTYLFFRH